MDISSSYLNTSQLNEKRQGIRHQKVLYILVAIELIVALIWSSFALYWWPQLGAEILKWWEFGLVAGILALLLVLVAFFVSVVRRLPITLDKSRLLYFGLWVFTVVISGFAIYSVCAFSYIPILESFILSFGIGAVVLIVFIVFTSFSLYLLILVAIAAVILAFFYASGLRTATKYSNFDDSEEDPVTGAVRFWIDGALVGCRFFEMIGRSFGSRA